MTPLELLTAYGYVAVLAGTLLEGESILLLAGVAAQQGHLSLQLVLLLAFVGGTLGDQALFWIGKRWGGSMLQRFPRLQVAALRVRALMERRDGWLVFGVRFAYGLRIAGPLAIGALGMAPGRFALFNAAGAAIWAVIIGGLGYGVGAGAQAALAAWSPQARGIGWVALFVVGTGLLMLVRRAMAKARPPQ